MLWGVVGAWGLWYIFGVMRPQEAFLRRAGALNTGLVQGTRLAFGVVAVVLLVLALAYPYFGTRARIHDRFDPAQGTGNDGLAFLDNPNASYVDFESRTGKGGEHDFASTRDATNWLRENVDGSPTTIEGITGIYHYGSRFSIYTGLPTVLGWDWHQTQQRQNFASTVEQRKSDVNAFYETDDVQQARDILRKYDVEWVIVGDVERNYYSDAGLEKFSDGLGGVLELAYQNPSTQIWHVIPSDELESAAVSSP
jgi:uncharacterized membrane protein